MFSNQKYKQKSFFRPARLLFEQTPPNPEQKAEKSPEKQPETPEKAQKENLEKAKTSAKLELMGDFMADSLTEEPPVAAIDLKEVAKVRNQELKEKAKSFYNALNPKTTEKIREIAKESAETRAEALRDYVTMEQLQGGYEWLGLTAETKHLKFEKLSQAYLRTETNEHGQEVFVVREELDYDNKTKYGIGAAHLLPPSITAITIVDKAGTAYHGTRQTINGRVGYYTAEGEYMPIYGGYTLIPETFINEDSQEYKTTVESELEQQQKIIEDSKVFYEGVSESNSETNTRYNVPKVIDNPIETTTKTLSAKDSPTGMPLYIDYPTNPELKRKEPKYLTYFHGDGGSIKNRKDILAHVKKLREGGINAILLLPEYDRTQKTDNRWDYFKKQPSPFDNLVEYMERATGSGAFNIVSFSGGYRAVAGILRNTKYTNKIHSVSMLDGTFPDSDDPIEKALIAYGNQGGKVRLVTRRSTRGQYENRTILTAQRIVQATKGRAEHIQTLLSHSSVNKNYLFSSLCFAAGVEPTMLAENNNPDPSDFAKLSRYIINQTQIEAKQGRCKKYSIPAHCEHFTDALASRLYYQLTCIKKRIHNFSAPIASAPTRYFRGKRIADLTEADMKHAKPGQAFFANSPRKYGNKIIPGTDNKLRKIADNRHWWMFTGFDSTGKPRFADNWGANHDLADMKRRYGGKNRVILNVHDGFASIRNRLEA